MSIGLAVIFSMILGKALEYRQIACYLILLGAITDLMDGHIARLYNAVSNMGKQLDSFADLVTFGIAPIAVFFVEIPMKSPTIFAIFMMFPIAGAYRLARYNIEGNSQYFIGLPITVAGSFLSLIYLIGSYMGYEIISPGFLTFVLLLVILLSVLMVSRFKVRRIMPKKKSTSPCRHST